MLVVDREHAIVRFEELFSLATKVDRIFAYFMTASMLSYQVSKIRTVHINA
jgi:hypothetical protein